MKEQQNPTPSKDYSLKQGEKIKINFGGMKVSILNVFSIYHLSYHV